MTSCNGQTTQSVTSDKSSPLISIGDTVKELGKNIMLVYQDTKNNYWFVINSYQAKQKVYRFDGNTLYELTLPKPPNLSNPFEVYSIYKDIKGNIWFGTNPVGVCRYDGKSFDWITEEDVTEFRNGGANGVRSITEDKNGDFWFNTEYRYTL